MKRRPRQVDLPVLVADVEQALELATAVPDSARRLMDRWWPGALTVVVPRRPDLEADLGDDEATIGLRCPDHEVPLALCRQVGPLATTSANLHGDETLTTTAEVVATFGTICRHRHRRRHLRGGTRRSSTAPASTSSSSARAASWDELRA